MNTFQFEPFSLPASRVCGRLSVISLRSIVMFYGIFASLLLLFSI